MRRRCFGGASALVLVAMLGGCGGGGGGGVNPTPAPPVSPAPAPVPTPAPSPTPTPTPTPSPSAVNFRTAEYTQSNLEIANAVPAYQAGITGRGVVAAVVDSGVNPASPEFAGRISAASQDVSASRGVGDDGGHGTAVSAVLLGAKNDMQVHGAAFEATLLSLRTDTPGSCTAEGDCSHADNNIARALDIATAQGARVANLSLGGTAANATLRAAIGRATAAGMVIVLSAGNDGGANPSALAQVAVDPAARNQVIVAGSHDSARQISSFSNRAGNTASVYLAALGQGVRSIDENGTAFRFDGTSFSAPYISGAIALLAQAFPNLTGAQLVQLLFDSADDLGAAGTDPIYGRGGLNIGRAFQPRGSASLAGSQTPVSLTADQATLSPAMGDAGAQTSMGAIILDGFDRAFAVDLARQVRNARPQASLAGSLTRPFRGVTLSAGGTSVAVSIADAPGGVALRRLFLSPGDAIQARATAGMVASRLDPKTSIALGFGQSAASVTGQLIGRASPAFLVARAPVEALGFDRRDQSAATLRHQLGRISLTATAERGEGLLFRNQLGTRDPYLRSPYSLFGIAADRRFGGVRLEGGLIRMQEDRTVLGASFGPLFGSGGASTWFADARADWAFGRGWTLGASARQGWTRMQAGGLLGADPLIRSNSFSFDIGKAGVFGGDALAVRLSQPLRVSSGALGFQLPVSYDYASGGVTFADQRLDLSPQGRELALEASYSRLLFGGRMDANLFLRRDPGHFEQAPDDLGAAVRWRLDF